MAKCCFKNLLATEGSRFLSPGVYWRIASGRGAKSTKLEDKISAQHMHVVQNQQNLRKELAHSFGCSAKSTKLDDKIGKQHRLVV